MSIENIFQIIGGFGLFLFALRYLSNSLSHSISRRFKPLINKRINTPYKSILVGFLLTIIVQASSISIIADMGLVGSALISLESGFFIMLGATLGTTIKTWFFSNLYGIGLLILGLSSVYTIFERKPLNKDIINVFLSLGLAFLGFDLMVSGLLPVSKLPSFEAIITNYSNDNFLGQLFFILIGAILTTLLQSSSAFIFIVIGFASQGIISFLIAAALILGANIGTTSTAVFISMEHNTNVKRLALSHFFIKLIGVIITLLFLPYFLSFIDLIIPGTIEENALYHLAGVHTVFNIINVIWWSAFSTFFLKFIKWSLPEKRNIEFDILPEKVRKMLANNPEMAFKEIEIQMEKMKNMTKNMNDHCLEVLTNEEKYFDRSNKIVLSREFETLTESILEIIIKLNTNYLSNKQKELIKEQISLINKYSSIYKSLLTFYFHLERGFKVDFFKLPKEIESYINEIHHKINELWFVVILDKDYTKEINNDVEILLDNLESFYFNLLSNYNNKQSYEFFIWFYESIIYLKNLLNELKNICFYKNLKASSNQKLRLQKPFD